MMEDGNGRKKVWICLSIVVLAAGILTPYYGVSIKCIT